MGRAQVVQAEAAMEIPRAFMNPILLKPNSDNNSQIIIEGKPVKKIWMLNHILLILHFKRDS